MQGIGQKLSRRSFGKNTKIDNQTGKSAAVSDDHIHIFHCPTGVECHWRVDFQSHLYTVVLGDRQAGFDDFLANRAQDTKGFKAQTRCQFEIPSHLVNLLALGQNTVFIKHPVDKRIHAGGFGLIFFHPCEPAFDIRFGWIRIRANRHLLGDQLYSMRPHHIGGCVDQLLQIFCSV